MTASGATCKALMHKIDIILPLYRPKHGWDEHVRENIRELRAFFGTKASLRFVIVDDGSGQGAFDPAALERVKNDAGDFQFLTYEPNRGKGYAVRFAAARSESDYIVYTDGDFPFGWRGVADAWNELEGGADVVMGVRDSGYSAALSPGRKLLSSCVRLLNRALLGMPVRYLDTQAGLKGFNGRGRKAFLAVKTETFLFDTEFILIAWTHKLKIDTVPLTLRPGLHFSRMGVSVMIRELWHFFRILWEFRILRKKVVSFDPLPVSEK